VIKSLDAGTRIALGLSQRRPTLDAQAHSHSRPSNAQHKTTTGPTMAVIAFNCPDIEVVVVDINEGKKKERA
jgi:hypothetical protein